MITKKLKLKTEDFSKLYTNLYNGNFLNIKIHHIKTKEQSRYGVVISKKISKLAVKRNKIKRLIFSIIQNLLKETNDKTSNKINNETSNKVNNETSNKTNYETSNKTNIKKALFLIKVKKPFTLNDKNTIIEEIKCIV